MNYEKHYFKLIENAKLKTTRDGYVERHHILPKCMGGNNDKTNIVILTSKEHFVAHHLLSKMYINNQKIQRAFTFMFIDPNGVGRYKRFTSSQFASRKEAYAKLKNEHLKGKVYVKNNMGEKVMVTIEEYAKFKNISLFHPNTGRKMSNETKIKCSESLKGRSSPTKGMSFSSFCKTGEKRGEKLIGISHSEETKQKQSDSIKKYYSKNPHHAKGKPQKIRECPYCKASGGNSLLRWHFENCKKRENI